MNTETDCYLRRITSINLHLFVVHFFDCTVAELCSTMKILYKYQYTLCSTYALRQKKRAVNIDSSFDEDDGNRTRNHRIDSPEL